MNIRYSMALAMTLTVATVGALNGGCSNDSDKGDGNGEGSHQTFKPPTKNDGSGRPAHATAVTCSQAEDCGNWYCGCADGAVVNSSFCNNGYCLDATAQCSDACTYFKHGEWTGEADGGPGKTPPATSSTSSSSSSGGGGSCLELGEFCSSNDDCCSLSCDGVCQSDSSSSGGGSCLEAGEFCSSAEECCSFACDGVCQ